MTAHATGTSEIPAQRPHPGSAAPEHNLNPLQRLIQQRLGERGWSYGDVARRGGLPRSTVYTLATTRNLVRPPRPATIDALAKGLDVPVSVVRAAAAESTGLHYYDEAPSGASAWRPGEGTPDRQHRRAVARRPASRRRARRIAAEQDVAGADRPVARPGLGLPLLHRPAGRQSPDPPASVPHGAASDAAGGANPQDRLQILTGRPQHINVSSFLLYVTMSRS